MQPLSMISKTVGAIATAALLSATLPLAANAQVTFGTSTDSDPQPNGAGPSLQEQLDYLIPNANDKIDTVNDESGAELFQSVGRGVTSFLLFEIAGFAPYNTVGLYNSADMTDTIELFSGDDEGVTRARVGQGLLNRRNFDTFGLYLTNKKGQTFYSEAGKNGGDDHFLAYQGSDSNPINIRGLTDNNLDDRNGRPTERINLRANDFLFAFEDLSFDDRHFDQDYNDFVGVIRRVTAVESVPEPTAMLGLVAVAGGAVAMRRRRQSA